MKKASGKMSGRMLVKASNKEKFIALLLCLLFGVLGMHRFYVGRPGTGALQLITLGGLGLWALWDFLKILVGRFEDGKGLLIED